jgi:putative glutathione S-transferase
LGRLVDGVWKYVQQEPGTRGGRFEREPAQFRNWVTPNGRPGPSGVGGFKAESGRYHLYVSWACPWAHRTLILRALKGLEGPIGLSVVHWRMREHGWTFAPGPGVVPDDINGAKHLYEIYVKASPSYSGAVTTPVLWDKARGTIVNNESAEIMRMFDSAFDGVGARGGDYYPAPLRQEIDALNARIYATVNDGVYRAGFATTQAAYEEAVRPLFQALDWLEERLAQRRYLCGDRITEADWRLFPTLIRFDTVYVLHFKCNLWRLIDYPHLWSYTRELYQHPDIAATVNFEHIKRHYFESHPSIDPTGIVPLGPLLDFKAPHRRDALNAQTSAR